jgi:hypothetical protein
MFDRIWELRNNLSAYNAAYVALAETLDCTLLTGDARISRTPGLRCPVTEAGLIAFLRKCSTGDGSSRFKNTCASRGIREEL